MDIFSIVAIAVTGTVISVFLKQNRPDFSLIISILTVSLIIFNIIGSQVTIFSELKMLIDKTTVSYKNFEILFKAVGICFLTQLVCNICKDAGQNAISLKVELAGRIAICICAIPLYRELISIIEKVIGKVT